MSNFEPNLIDLKLIYNDDGSATLDTKNTVYESYDINLVKIIASIFIDRDVTKYCFFMYLKDPKFPNYDYTWAIKLKNTSEQFLVFILYQMLIQTFETLAQ